MRAIARAHARRGAAAAGRDPAGRGSGPAAGQQDRKVLVFEPASGGLLTLLAHSAVSDLAQLERDRAGRHGHEPGQGTAMLAAEPFRCVVVDLGMPAALEFLDQVQEKPDLREIPVLAHAPGEPGTDTRDRLAALRSGYPRLSCCRRSTTCASGSRCTCPRRSRGRCPRSSATRREPVAGPLGGRASA